MLAKATYQLLRLAVKVTGISLAGGMEAAKDIGGEDLRSHAFMHSRCINIVTHAEDCVVPFQSPHLLSQPQPCTTELGLPLLVGGASLERSCCVYLTNRH